MTTNPSTPNADAPAEDGYLTAGETAALTRFSDRYVRLLAERGQLPHIRVGHSLRFRRADVHAFMAAHRVESQQGA